MRSRRPVDKLIVPAYGPQPAAVLVVGERPGYYESRAGIPFVGPSGVDLERYLARAGISLERCRRTNVCRDYIDGNPDPTPKEIRAQAGELRDEISRTSPEWVIAVGRIAARTLTGLDLSMDSAHGMVFPAADEWSLNGARVICAYHTAYALKFPEAAPTVAADYLRAGAYIRGDISPITPEDEFSGHEDYRELEDDDFATIESLCDPSSHHWGGLALDTEGYRTDPWMIQLSAMPGSGYIINARQHALVQFLDDEIERQNPLVIFHHSLHDLEVMRAMRMRAPKRFTDTMVLAYLLQTEPQGLKPLARRYAGMEMLEYREVVAPAQAALAQKYFARVIDQLDEHPEWDERPEQVVIEDGAARIMKPHSIAMRVRRIVNDAEKLSAAASTMVHAIEYLRATKANYVRDDSNRAVRILKDGSENIGAVDYFDRFMAIPDDMRAQIDEVVGSMPVATLMHVPLAERVHYAARDPDATLRVYKPLRATVEALDLTRVLELDLATVPMFERMQSNGFELDVPALEELSVELKHEMQAATRTVGCNPAPNSKQLVDVFDELRLPRPDKVTEKLGLPKIDDSYLEGLETTLAMTSILPVAGLPIVRAVLRYRECAKIESTYAGPLPKLMDSDGRLRTSFRITRVVTGRPASAEPNLLNIPVRTELGRRVRSAFVARKGHILATADYSGIEMRVMAHISGDENMIEVFRAGKDIHAQTASRAFGIPESQLDPMKHRYPAKRMGFLVIFGGGAKKLRQELAIVGIRWALDDCQKLIDDYVHKLYPGIGRYMIARQTEAKRFGFVRDGLSGRVRYLPDATSPDKWKRFAAFREATNFPIQGGAATIMKDGMIECWRRLPELWSRGIYAEPLLQQYDELTWEVQEDAVEDLRELVVDSMTNAFELTVPIEVSWGAGRTWAELEK